MSSRPLIERRKTRFWRNKRAIPLFWRLKRHVNLEFSFMIFFEFWICAHPLALRWKQANFGSLWARKSQMSSHENCRRYFSRRRLALSRYEYADDRALWTWREAEFARKHEPEWDTGALDKRELECDSRVVLSESEFGSKELWVLRKFSEVLVSGVLTPEFAYPESDMRARMLSPERFKGLSVNEVDRIFERRWWSYCRMLKGVSRCKDFARSSRCFGGRVSAPRLARERELFRRREIWFEEWRGSLHDKIHKTWSCKKIDTISKGRP